jgi:anti-sigma B factor antagonist
MSDMHRAGAISPLVRCLVDERLPRVILVGDIDLLVRPGLENALAAIRQRGPADVVVDATAVTFLGCVGLSFLASLSEHCRSQGRNLYLVTSKAAVLRMVRFAGLEGALTVLDPASPTTGPLHRSATASSVPVARDETG